MIFGLSGGTTLKTLMSLLSKSLIELRNIMKTIPESRDASLNRKTLHRSKYSAAVSEQKSANAASPGLKRTQTTYLVMNK